MSKVNKVGYQEVLDVRRNYQGKNYFENSLLGKFIHLLVFGFREVSTMFLKFHKVERESLKFIHPININWNHYIFMEEEWGNQIDA